MRKYLTLILILLTFYINSAAQNYIGKSRHLYVSDTAFVHQRKPWLAAGQTFGINIAVWAANRFIFNEDFARINFKTIKNNFKTGPVWDTDKFTTNLIAHPYHGSLYFNAARSNGMNFWESAPYAAAGSLMWEFFMEAEPPSINDMLATTLGGIELGEITYRLSDLFLDNRTSGKERIAREILSGLISPIRALNRLITGEAWKISSSKGRSYTSVPVDFIASVGCRFLGEQLHSSKHSISMNMAFAINYGNPYNDSFYSPYEWFRFQICLDMFSGQPLVSQANAIGAIWGKSIWEKGTRFLTLGIFQHFDYYNSQMRSKFKETIAPYKISEAAAMGVGFIYQKKTTPADNVDIYAEGYANGIALGASVSDHFRIDNRDYNLGSGYSVKLYSGITWKKRWSFLLNMENYHIFTWKGYDPDIDLGQVDPETFNAQGDEGHANMSVFSASLAYSFPKTWSLALTNRYFSRRSVYKYLNDVERNTYDIMLTLNIRI